MHRSGEASTPIPHSSRSSPFLSFPYAQTLLNSSSHQPLTPPFTSAASPPSQTPSSPPPSPSPSSSLSPPSLALSRFKRQSGALSTRRRWRSLGRGWKGRGRSGRWIRVRWRDWCVAFFSFSLLVELVQGPSQREAFLTASLTAILHRPLPTFSRHPPLPLTNSALLPPPPLHLPPRPAPLLPLRPLSLRRRLRLRARLSRDAVLALGGVAEHYEQEKGEEDGEGGGGV